MSTIPTAADFEAHGWSPEAAAELGAIAMQFPAYTTPKPGSNPPVPVWGAAALAASRERRNAHIVERNLARVRSGQLL